MNTRVVASIAIVFWAGIGFCRGAGSATVTEAVNIVNYGSQSTGDFSPAGKGTPIRAGDAVRTGPQSRAELLLPTTSITRLGSNTIFNYSVDSNEVDLQAGTILFCKPKGAQQLNIKTAAVTAGITGTTGFVSVQGEGKKRIYTSGLIEGHAIAHADDHPFALGPGDILQFRPGQKPFMFAYDVPRFLKSSTLVKKFSSTLPNQAAIDRELAEYADDVSRGFIVPPSKAIDYSGDIPVLSTLDFGSAQNAQGQASKGGAPPPPAQTSGRSGSGYSGSLYLNNGGH